MLVLIIAQVATPAIQPYEERRNDENHLLRDGFHYTCILMKKRIFALTVLMLLLALPISVQAAQPWAINNRPTLSFSRTTASCYVDCKGANTKDKISATLTLNQGSTYVDSWSGSGTGSVFVSGQHAVKSGKKYTLTLSYSVNGVAKPSVSVTNTCP